MEYKVVRLKYIRKTLLSAHCHHPLAALGKGSSFEAFCLESHPLPIQGRHCPTLAGMARVETPVSFAHLISFLAIFSCFLPLCHRILPIVSPVFEIFKTPGMAIAIPAILVSPPLMIETTICSEEEIDGLIGGLANTILQQIGISIIIKCSQKKWYILSGIRNA